MLGRLFGFKKAAPEDRAFTADFEDALQRYLGAPDSVVEYEFKDRKGNVIPPSYAFEGAYREWKNIQSVWDRRCVIFKALDEVYLRKISRAQVLERFIIDRYPEKALAIAEKFATDEDRNDPDYLASLARCYFFLADYQQSATLANQAMSRKPDHKRARIALADSLHLLGRHGEAHDIYHEIIASGKMNEWAADTISVLDIVGFRHDILHSSVYAVGLLSSDESNEGAWSEVAGEFYYCPYFRSQHAFWLIENGEAMQGLVKLLMTAQEFPWFRDAVVNARSGMLQMREQMQSPGLWAEELAGLDATMEQYGWK